MNAMDGHKVLIKLGKKLKANTYEGEVVKIIGHKMIRELIFYQ